MSIRKAKNKMSGRMTFQPVIVLGRRVEDGSPGVTVHVNYGAYGCFADPEAIEKFIDDLQVGLAHLRGENVEDID